MDTRPGILDTGRRRGSRSLRAGSPKDDLMNEASGAKRNDNTDTLSTERASRGEDENREVGRDPMAPDR
jgi:hypothetical protein